MRKLDSFNIWGIYFSVLFVYLQSGIGAASATSVGSTNISDNGK